MILKKEYVESRFTLLEKGFEYSRSYKNRSAVLKWNGTDLSITADYAGSKYVLGSVDPLLLRFIGWVIEDYFEPWGEE